MLLQHTWRTSQLSCTGAHVGEWLTVHKVLKFREIADALSALSVAQRIPKPRTTYPLRLAYLRKRGKEGSLGSKTCVTVEPESSCRIGNFKFCRKKRTDMRTTVVPFWEICSIRPGARVPPCLTCTNLRLQITFDCYPKTGTTMCEPHTQSGWSFVKVSPFLKMARCWPNSDEGLTQGLQVLPRILLRILLCPRPYKTFMPWPCPS